MKTPEERKKDSFANLNMRQKDRVVRLYRRCINRMDEAEQEGKYFVDVWCGDFNKKERAEVVSKFTAEGYKACVPLYSFLLGKSLKISW